MKCPNCKTDAVPQVVGPYDRPHPFVPRVAYLVCTNCDVVLSGFALPSDSDQPKAA